MNVNKIKTFAGLITILSAVICVLSFFALMNAMIFGLPILTYCIAGLFNSLAAGLLAAGTVKLLNSESK
jgi:hypothetical protein